MPRTAFLFPGQGAQIPGMGKTLFDELPAARDLFHRADEILGFSLSEICFQGPAETLNSTVISQPALYVVSMAALEKLKTDQPEVYHGCVAAAGLSLGEYTAIAFAGSLSFEDGLRLVQQRGEAMQAAADETPSGMVSVLGLDQEKTAVVCDQARQPGEVLQIANLLCQGNIAVSGHRASCEAVADVAQAAGAMKTVPLAVAGAFHTPLMESAVPKLKAALTNIDLKPARIPVYSNVDANPHQSPEEIRKLLEQQVCGPVLWQQSIEQMMADGIDSFYEIGAGRVLRGILKRINRKVSCIGVPE